MTERPTPDMASVSGLELDVPTILERAADTLAAEGAWTQGELARDADGKEVSPTDERAVCWCISGAIMRASGDPIIRLSQFRTLEQKINLFPVWNDEPGRTQTEVVEVLREAAALARSSVELGGGG